MRSVANQSVPSEVESKYLATATTKKQQKRLEQIFDGQQKTIMSNATSNTASNTTPKASPNAVSRTPLNKQTPETIMTPTSGAPKHSSTPLNDKQTNNSSSVQGRFAVRV